VRLHARRAGLLALGLAAAAACRTARPPPEAPPEIEDYAPFAIGNAWTYAVRFPGQSGERTVRITGRDEVGYWLDDAGGAFRITKEGLRDRKRYLLRRPLEPGTTWRAVVSASAVERYRVTSVGEPCETRAGRFADCVVVESTLRRDAKVSLRVRFTWARDVGLAKVETAALVEGEGEIPQTEQSLLRYALATGSGGEAAPGAGRADDRGEADPPDTWGR
jgi:hypothetical protein